MNRLEIMAAALVVAGGLVCGVSRAQQPAASDAGVPPVLGLVPDHAAVSVENLQKEAEWYQRILGFKVLSKFESNPDLINWHLVIPGYRIDLIKQKGSKRPPPVDPIYLQQGWLHVVFHVDDVAAAWKVLQAHHVDVAVSKDDKGTPIQLHIQDPEGNALEIRRNLVM
jgi:catechol 2,3-dioxygenase-like lactoylglutathione lyase family enzyme